MTPAKRRWWRSWDRATFLARVASRVSRFGLDGDSDCGNDRTRDRKEGNDSRPPRGTRFFRPFHFLQAFEKHPNRGGLGRSAFQFQREAAGSHVVAAGTLWQGR